LTLSSSVGVGISTPGTWICCSGLPGGSIPEGTEVNSYLLYASPESNPAGQDFRDFTGRITFSPGEKIVGIIIGYKQLSNTDGELGAPGTVYPPPSYALGGLENTDEVILGNGETSVYVNFHVNAADEGIDMIRILTEVPEPADFLLIGSGLIALAFWKRRSLSQRATER
jgi:hypothetical protein